MSSMSSSDFMKLDTIARIILGPIKSYMWEIIPDRENGSIDQIRKKEFIEHEDDPERKDNILMTHDIAIVPRFFHYLCIITQISDPDKNRLDPKNIGLFYQIDENCAERKKEVSRDEYIEKGVDRRMCRLTNNESSMNWEEDREDKNKIYRDTDEEYRKSEREKSTRCPDLRITDEENKEEDIDTHTDNSPEYCLEHSMQWNIII